ncbi:MAG: hypothetical protein HZC42_05310 [Candidatus Eisenbacteria bacterium]|nr:hypothetical protein [Candidatus Eisenbacteria bacterium]
MIVHPIPTASPRPRRPGAAAAPYRCGRCLLLFALIAGLAPGTVAPFAGAASTASVTVDCAQELGAFSPRLFGTIAAPYFDPSGYAMTQASGFDLVQVGFQIPVPSNPNDSTLYDFTTLDQQVGAVVGIGAEPLVVYGLSRKPADLTAYATYVANIARHLNQGWGSGHFWNARAFRFGNEPDNPAYWQGTQQEFFQSYAAWAAALKAVDASYDLDTPALMSVRGTAGPESLSTWAVNFLSYCQTNGVPVDHFSFHAYSPLPYYAFYDNCRRVQAALLRYPTLSPLYGSPRAANDEWNTMVGDVWSGSYHAQFDSAWVAAHNIVGLINMVEQGLQLSIRYGGTFNGSPGGCHDFPLTDCAGQGKPAYHAFRGFSWLAGAIRLATTGTDHMNLAAVAGRRGDTIVVVVSDFDVTRYLGRFESGSSPAWTEYNRYVASSGVPAVYDGLNLTLQNLPWSASQQLVMERYLVDDQHALALVDSAAATGSAALFLSAAMAAPSVHVMRIYATGGTTGVGDPGPRGADAGLKAWPVPARDEIRFSVPGVAALSVDIFDVRGCRIARLGGREATLVWNARGHRPGIYFARAAGERGRPARIVVLP